LDRDAVGACAGAIARGAGVGGSSLAVTINEGATASAVAGLGIAASSENSARAELEAGKLVRVLPDWDFGSMEVALRQRKDHKACRTGICRLPSQEAPCC
jgi:DNA-binding transcriptional LysR family regulator